jgi:hypothetical protein
MKRPSKHGTCAVGHYRAIVSHNLFSPETRGHPNLSLECDLYMRENHIVVVLVLQWSYGEKCVT